jgi:hypothetical protein
VCLKLITNNISRYRLLAICRLGDWCRFQQAFNQSLGRFTVLICRS